MIAALRDWRNKSFYHVGPCDFAQGNPLPVGLSKVTTDGQLAFAFLDPESKEVVSMFSLDPGKHIVKVPADVHIIAECKKDVKWLVQYSKNFNKSDPTRIEASVLRPRDPREEMREYFNEVAARAMGSDWSEKLKKGEAEIDTTYDDYSEYLPDDDGMIPPMTVHQLGLVIDELQKDIKRSNDAIAKAKAQKDIEEEAPPVPLKTKIKTAGTKGKDSVSAESGEVEQ